jgi:hypothetical protein
MSDRLAEIKDALTAWHRSPSYERLEDRVSGSDVDWLIAEVERLRGKLGKEGCEACEGYGWLVTTHMINGQIANAYMRKCPCIGGTPADRVGVVTPDNCAEASQSDEMSEAAPHPREVTSDG